MSSQTEKSTRRCIQQNHEQLLFILILSLICPAVLQGPQVQSAEYVVKSYADFTAELQLAVVTGNNYEYYLYYLSISIIRLNDYR
jgi:hypothetical protein